MEDYAITNVRLDDIQDLKKIEVDCELSPWTIGAYGSEYRRSDSVMLKATSEDDRIWGFIVGRAPLEGGEADIYNLGVAPRFRRRGVATILLREFRRICAERHIAALWLEVRATNEAAVSFYFSHGFARKGVRPGFYSDPPDDAIVMSAPVI